MEKLPQCDELNTKYKDCCKEWYKTCWKEKRINSLDVCDPFFQDYRDCIAEGMQRRIEAKKKEREMRDRGEGGDRAK